MQNNGGAVSGIGQCCHTPNALTGSGNENHAIPKQIGGRLVVFEIIHKQ